MQLLTCTFIFRCIALATILLQTEAFPLRSCLRSWFGLSSPRGQRNTSCSHAKLISCSAAESENQKKENTISSIQIYASQYVDKICFIYSDGSWKQYGQALSHSPQVFSLESGEYLKQIRFKQDNHHIKELKFYTNRKVSVRYGKGDPELPWHFEEGTESQPIVGIVVEDTTCFRITGVVRCV